MHITKAFSGFSVNNIDAAKEFYSNTLGAELTQDWMGLQLKIGNGVFIYQKDDHQPATYTVLNIPVDDIDVAVQDLKSKGIVFESYEGLTDDTDVARGLDHDMGPNIAWFKDPAGNILSILQTA